MRTISKLAAKKLVPRSRPASLSANKPANTAAMYKGMFSSELRWHDSARSYAAKSSGLSRCFVFSIRVVDLGLRLSCFDRSPFVEIEIARP